MAVRTAKILPLEAVPASDLADQFDTCGEQFASRGLHVIDLKSDNGIGGQLSSWVIASEDLQLLARSDAKDRKIVGLDFDG